MFVLVHFTRYLRIAGIAVLICFLFLCLSRRWTRQTVFYRADSASDRTWVIRSCVRWWIPEITIDWGISRWTEDSPIALKKPSRGYVLDDINVYRRCYGNWHWFQSRSKIYNFMGMGLLFSSELQYWYIVESRFLVVGDHQNISFYFFPITISIVKKTFFWKVKTVFDFFQL